MIEQESQDALDQLRTCSVEMKMFEKVAKGRSSSLRLGNIRYINSQFQLAAVGLSNTTPCSGAGEDVSSTSSPPAFGISSNRSSELNIDYSFRPVLRGQQHWSGLWPHHSDSTALPTAPLFFSELFSLMTCSLIPSS